MRLKGKNIPIMHRVIGHEILKAIRSDMKSTITAWIKTDRPAKLTVFTRLTSLAKID